MRPALMRWARRLVVAGLVWLGVLVVGLAWVWRWAGQDGSLATTVQALEAGGALQRVAAQLGLDYGQVSVQGVQGNLREGGRLDFLRWRHSGREVKVHQLSLGWAWVTDRVLPWQPQALTIQRLVVHWPASPEPLVLPRALTLPGPLSVALKVDDFSLTGSARLSAQKLAAHYRYETGDGGRHHLRLDALQLAQGRYAGELQLQAQHPLALRGDLIGQVDSPVAGGRVRHLHAQATLRGTLAPLADAALDVQVDVQRDGGSGPAPLNLSARILPWADQPLHDAHVQTRGLDLAAWWPGAPRTDLAGQAHWTPDGAAWQADIRLSNREPGPWDRGRLPLDRLQTRLRHEAGRWTLQDLVAGLGPAQVQGQARWEPGTASQGHNASGRWSLAQINPAALHSSLAPARLGGQVALVSRPDAGLGFVLDIQPEAGAAALPPGWQGLSLHSLKAQGEWVAQAQDLVLDTLVLQAADARLTAQGRVRVATRTWVGQAQLQLPGGQVRQDGTLPWSARLDAPTWDSLSLQIELPQLAQAWAWAQRWPGTQALRELSPQGALDAQLQLQAGPGHAAGPALKWVVQSPRLHWAGGGLPGGLALRDWRVEADGRWAELAWRWRGELEQAPWRVHGQAEGQWLGDPLVGQGQLRVQQARLTGHDSLRALSLRLDALARVGAPTGSPVLSAYWQGPPGGPGTAFWLEPGRVQLTPLDAPGNPAPKGEPVAVSWEQLRWGPEGWRTQGRLSGLPLAWVDWVAGPQLQPLAQAGLSGQLLLDGDWDVLWPQDSATPVQVQAGLQRQRGDLSLALEDGPGTVAAGIREASVRLSAQGPVLSARLRWDSERAGQLDAQARTELRSSGTGWSWPAAAPVAGQLKAQMPQIGVWSLLAPPGWRLRGTVAAQAQLAGTRERPQWSGELQADQLALRSVVDGVEFVNGRLRARVSEQQLTLDEVRLEGAGGEKAGGVLTAQGTATWPVGAQGRREPQLRLSVLAQRLRVSNRADRRLVVSGQGQAQLNGPRLQLRAQLKADQASFSLADELTPRLGSDVVVRRPGQAPGPTGPAAQVVVPDVQLDIDLGPSFNVQGHGLATRLEGQVQVRSTPVQPSPRLVGDVRTVQGSYRAYGVNLQIDNGLLRFSGAYDNPSLDILALRPDISRKVGVQVSGTAQVPVVRLYAEPELPDTEKLSWLVLGRSASGQGGEAVVLQQAAMSLLGRKGQTLDAGLAAALGLDEVSLRTGASQGAVTGAALTLGKRLSNKLYLSYNQSLSGTLGTVSVLYDLSRRLRLRAKAGDDNALELVFTHSFD